MATLKSCTVLDTADGNTERGALGHIGGQDVSDELFMVVCFVETRGVIGVL